MVSSPVKFSKRPGLKIIRQKVTKIELWVSHTHIPSHAYIKASD